MPPLLAPPFALPPAVLVDVPPFALVEPPPLPAPPLPVVVPPSELGPEPPLAVLVVPPLAESVMPPLALLVPPLSALVEPPLELLVPPLVLPGAVYDPHATIAQTEVEPHASTTDRRAMFRIVRVGRLVMSMVPFR
jgi:hypothetical protein